GVTSEEVRRNSNDALKSEYKADTAFSFGTTLTAEYKMTEKLSLVGILGVEKFSDEITDSPIVDKDPIFIASIGAKYFF
ncbi:MAG: MipA/OmpV family protein, partial [Cetobacterium sp.]